MTRPIWRAALAMLAALALTGTAAASPGQVFPLDAIGRLTADGDRNCTAFVIRSIERRAPGSFGQYEVLYENWIATAGHCLGRDIIFQLGSRQYQVRVVGFSGGGAQGYDVLIATFLTYQPVPTLEPAFGEYPQIGDNLMLIGYGRNVLMMRVGPLLRYDDRGHMEIHGFASPGNSGGPVLIPGTRRVVGIGIETTLQRPEGVSSVICAMGGCAVKPPYVASHIDRLRGVASFR